MTPESFWGHVAVGPSCWEWQGERTRRVGGELSYGRVNWEGRSQRAHRVAWELVNGPIPAGLHVLHHCDNPPCVNPAHLFLGTHTDNMRDMVAKGRNARPTSERARRMGELGHAVLRAHPELRGRAIGERNTKAKLTADQVREIRASDECQRRLAERYGVSNQLISQIRARLVWRHVA